MKTVLFGHSAFFWGEEFSLQALEQQLCRDVVLQNATLESLQTQMAEWQEQLTRSLGDRSDRFGGSSQDL